MDELTAEQVRVLGALVEKERTVPDSYPMSMNALMNACNQTSSRDPVVAYDENTVADAVRGLRERGLVRGIHRADARVSKFQHLLDEKWGLNDRDLAVMDVLMLRGAQTVGEIRTRSARLFDFPNVEEVEATLQALMDRAEPFVVCLPRQPGQKEVRYAHLLSGEALVSSTVGEVDPVAAPTPRGDRVSSLEARVEAMEREMAALRAQLDGFRKQFE